MIRVNTWEPATFVYTPAQRDATGAITTPAVLVEVEIKRLTVNESGAFDALWYDAMVGKADRLISARRDDELAQRIISAVSADELEAAEREAARLATLEPASAGVAAREAYVALLERLQPTDVFVIPLAEVRRRRLAEMSAEDRARYDAALEADRKAQIALIERAITDYVRVKPGQMFIDDLEVTTGADLGRAIGSRGDVTSELLALVRGINLMNDAEKKAWRSRSTSRTSSSTRDREAPGSSPEGVALSVSAAGSAASEGAMPTAASPSGVTAASA